MILIKIETITDHEDGTATLTLDMDAETYQKIFEYGFVQLVMKGIESEEMRDESIELCLR
jgi:hypothetical protein